MWTRWVLLIIASTGVYPWLTKALIFPRRSRSTPSLRDLASNRLVEWPRLSLTTTCPVHSGRGPPASESESASTNWRGHVSDSFCLSRLQVSRVFIAVTDSCLLRNLLQLRWEGLSESRKVDHELSRAKIWHSNSLLFSSRYVTKAMFRVGLRAVSVLMMNELVAHNLSWVSLVACKPLKVHLSLENHRSYNFLALTTSHKHWDFSQFREPFKRLHSLSSPYPLLFSRIPWTWHLSGTFRVRLREKPIDHA